MANAELARLLMNKVPEVWKEALMTGHKSEAQKLLEKNCDWIIANDVSNNSIGFDSDFNEVSIFYKNKEIKNEKLAIKKKSEISEEIADRVIKQLN